MTAKSRRFPAFFFTSLIVALTLAACGNASSGSAKSGTTTTGGTTPTTGACTDGTVQVDGITTRKFCGPAKATVVVAGQTFNLSGGACFTLSGLAGVNIGQTVLDTSDAGKALKKKLTYLGAEVQADKDGTYDNAIFSGYTNGVDFTSIGTLTFTNNLQTGAFTGTAILSKAAVTGTFTCS